MKDGAIWMFGTANETWGGDYYANDTALENGDVADSAKSSLSSEVEDAEQIAKAITGAIERFNNSFNELKIADLVEDALNAACFCVQEKLGQDDGGLASMFFSGDNEHTFKRLFTKYIKAELAQLTGDYED